MAQLSVFVPHNEIAIASTHATASSDTVTSWQASTKKGTISGIAVSVSGQGAWAKLKGNATFSLRSMESSKTYNRIKNEYNIGGGVSAFWSWLGINANASTHKEEISEMFTEISQSQNVEGHVDIELFASGIYPNVEVTAMAYVLVLQITNDMGNSYQMFSTGDSIADTGASNQDGKTLPSKDNNSVISI